MSLTYSRYLAVDRLLELQIPRSGRDWTDAEHDEHLFIVIHQVYELWFKQILHELNHLCRELEDHRVDDDRTPRIRSALKRILTIMKTLVSQVDILETMTPVSFNSFRARLDESSGFQSPQFRELEFVLGHRRPSMLRYHESNPTALEQLKARLDEPTLYQRFLRYLRNNGYSVPDEALELDPENPVTEVEAVRPELVRIYHQDDRLTQVCERLVDFDEGLQEWRYRHVKMVERTIGTKPGTGGSPGADYLKTTLFKPIFPDLWAIRADL